MCMSGTTGLLDAWSENTMQHAFMLPPQTKEAGKQSSHLCTLISQDMCLWWYADSVLWKHGYSPHSVRIDKVKEIAIY